MAGGSHLPRVRGIQQHQETREEFLFRDTRSVVTRFFDWIRVPQNMASLLFGHAITAIFAPVIAIYVLLSAGIFFIWGMRQQEAAPLKMPKQGGFIDRNELSPANRSPQKADGIFFLGNDMTSGKELWLTNSDCRQHFLVLGTTGSGKTELLLGFAANALSWGSGFLFCDGKGDVALFAKVYALSRLFGREDDLLVLNFMTGNVDIGAADPKKRSNTLNPFSTGSSDSLTQMMVSLMDDTGGDGAMWKGRATAMFTGVMRALTWLRDQGRVDLNIGLIRQFLDLRRIIELAEADTYNGMPQSIRHSVSSYLTSLPGYQAGKEKQAQTTLDQHGYLEMQFTKILGSLADVYGHIFMTPYGEVDMYDVVVNRRILVIMLPALEKSPDEIANLGKIVIATLKGMMGATLGSTIDGSWNEVVERRPTNSPSPFIVVLDEAGYYIGDGVALMTAQARSLGFSLVIASQDMPSLKRRNEKEAGSIVANTATKLFMKTEEPEDTARLAIAVAGKSKVSRLDRYSGTAGEVATTYRDTMDARIDETDRIHGSDLRAQISGEMHVAYQDKMIRAKAFYSAPETAIDIGKLHLRTNSMIPIPKPGPADLERIRIEPDIARKLVSPAFADKMTRDAKTGVMQPSTLRSTLDQSMAVFIELRESKSSLCERACASIAAAVGAHRLQSNGVNPDGSASSPDVKASNRGVFGSIMNKETVDDDDINLIPGLEKGMTEAISIDDIDADLKGYANSKLTDGFDENDNPHGIVIDDDASKLIEMGGSVYDNPQVHEVLANLDFNTSVKSSEEVNAAIDRAIFRDRALASGGQSQKTTRETIEETLTADQLAMAVGEVDRVLKPQLVSTDDLDATDLTEFFGNLFATGDDDGDDEPHDD